MAQQGITPRSEDYSQWYLDVIAAGELTDKSPVRGCMVIKPHGYGIWENIQSDLDARFKATGHVNAYFPLFIPESFLSKEADHVEGFAKECAVITHHRLRSAEGGGVEPDPAAKLEEPLVVRPTSETIIWHMYGKWINSYRDLPLLINQWANVVRWEMRTRPFLRTAEFLWQEGHTAHATREEAMEEATRMLGVYTDFARETLAIPVIPGIKSATERFAGADETFTIEAMMQNGWALQAGTSHFLGQNFAKAFDVTFQSASGELEHVWATSWGVSTRLVGATIMAHSDDTGLVLPPKLAPIQVVLVPIWRKDEDQDRVLAFTQEVADRLGGAVRIHVDDRVKMKPGAKYFEWERKGVPLRFEIGPRDVDNNSVFCAKRTGDKKFPIPVEDGFLERVLTELDGIQQGLLQAAVERRAANTHEVASYDEMKASMDESPGFYLVPWHDDAVTEREIKDDCKATIRCFRAKIAMCGSTVDDQQHTWRFLRAHTDRAPPLFIALMVLCATAWFATVNIGNAERFAPQWSQDLAFFHQWIHSAASGGVWGSPLILEPQGFFEQVHTHLILPIVVALYWLYPHQNLLLVLHSFFICLALWPTFRLGEQLAGGRYAALCVLALLAFGPFQAVATADFRPLSLFLPGFIGVWASARQGNIAGMLAWALLALMGRQEAAYLLISSGLAMSVFPWGRCKRRFGLVLIVLGMAAWVFFVVMKPTMFFHVNPMEPRPWPDSAELWDRRGDFGLDFVLSGWSVGLFSIGPVLAGAPVLFGMLSGHHEWHLLAGPGVHHHIFWLPFVVVAAVSAVHRIPTGVGPMVLIAASAFSYPWVQNQQGNLALQGLVDQIPASAKVGADYDTIHRLSGRKVLWNIDHFYMPDQPWHWDQDWPITVDDVDWLLMPAEHPISAHVGDWKIVSTASNHVLLHKP